MKTFCVRPMRRLIGTAVGTVVFLVAFATEASIHGPSQFAGLLMACYCEGSARLGWVVLWTE